MIGAIAEEVNYAKREVQHLRSDKESLENVLALKAQEVRKTLTNEASRYYSHCFANYYLIEWRKS